MNSDISRKKLREFGYLLGIIFPLFIGWLIPLLTGHGFRTWTLLVSIPVSLISIFAPHKLNTIFRWWMKLGLALGWVNSKIIFTIVFLLVLIPIAFIMKLFGYDPMGLKKNLNSTYREDNIKSKTDLTRIF